LTILKGPEGATGAANILLSVIDSATEIALIRGADGPSGGNGTSVALRSGAAAGAGGASGLITIQPPDSDIGGSVAIGGGLGDTGNGGDAFIGSGSSDSGDGGTLSLLGGGSSSGTGGSIVIQAGASGAAGALNGGDIALVGGNSGGANGGAVSLVPGAGGIGGGVFFRITEAGAIDFSYDLVSRNFGAFDVNATLRVAEVTTTQRDALNLQPGLIVLNSTTGNFEGYDGTVWATLTT
jgi:hypothetical protein